MGNELKKRSNNATSQSHSRSTELASRHIARFVINSCHRYRQLKLAEGLANLAWMMVEALIVIASENEGVLRIAKSSIDGRGEPRQKFKSFLVTILELSNHGATNCRF
jgi:hypothetical protein